MLPCWRVHDNQLLLYSFSLIPTNTRTQSVYNNAYTQNSRPHNHTGWLGVKHQVTTTLASVQFLFLFFFVDVICANVLSCRYANSDVTLFFPVCYFHDIFSVEDATELAGVPTDCLWADLGILCVSWVDPTASAHVACKWYFLLISTWTLASTSRPHLVKPAIGADCSAIAFSRFDMQLFKMDHIYQHCYQIWGVFFWAGQRLPLFPQRPSVEVPTFTATDDVVGTAVLLLHLLLQVPSRCCYWGPGSLSSSSFSSLGSHSTSGDLVCHLDRKPGIQDKSPRREARDVWCKPLVWNLRAVIWFPFPISSLVFLPSPLALSVLSIFC